MQNGFRPKTLRNVMADEEWSNQDVADITGVHPIQVSRWLNGHNEPRPRYLKRIAEKASVKISDFFDPVEIPDEPKPPPIDEIDEIAELLERYPEKRGDVLEFLRAYDAMKKAGDRLTL